MKTTLIALALAATTFAAQATTWIEFPAGDEAPGLVSLDSEVASDRTGAGTLAQFCSFSLKRCARDFVYVNTPECKQGFGYLRYRDLDGKPKASRVEYVLGNPVTVADQMAEYLCNALPTTTARKSK